MRGVRFQLLNDYEFGLKEILRSFVFGNHVCLVTECEIYDKENKKLCNDGCYMYESFENIISQKAGCIISLNLQVFSKESEIEQVANYDEFIRSNCKMILLMADSTFIDIYIKDKYVFQIKKLEKYILEKGGEYFEVDDDNDTRYKFSVW